MPRPYPSLKSVQFETDSEPPLPLPPNRRPLTRMPSPPSHDNAGPLVAEEAEASNRTKPFWPPAIIIPELQTEEKLASPGKLIYLHFSEVYSQCKHTSFGRHGRKQIDPIPEIVRPSDLCFTQVSVPPKMPFGAKGSIRLDDAIDSLLSGQLQPAAFLGPDQALHVVQTQERLWCLDNSVLWVFVKAGITQIPILIYDIHHAKCRFDAHKFSAKTRIFNGLSADLSHSTFVPRVKWGTCRYEKPPAGMEESDPFRISPRCFLHSRSDPAAPLHHENPTPFKSTPWKTRHLKNLSDTTGVLLSGASASIRLRNMHATPDFTSADDTPTSLTSHPSSPSPHLDPPSSPTTVPSSASPSESLPPDNWYLGSPDLAPAPLTSHKSLGADFWSEKSHLLQPTEVGSWASKANDDDVASIESNIHRNWRTSSSSPRSKDADSAVVVTSFSRRRFADTEIILSQRYVGRSWDVLTTAPHIASKESDVAARYDRRLSPRGGREWVPEGEPASRVLPAGRRSLERLRSAEEQKLEHHRSYRLGRTMEASLSVPGGILPSTPHAPIDRLSGPRRGEGSKKREKGRGG